MSILLKVAKSALAGFSADMCDRFRNEFGMTKHRHAELVSASAFMCKLDKEEKIMKRMRNVVALVLLFSMRMSAVFADGSVDLDSRAYKYISSSSSPLYSESELLEDVKEHGSIQAEFFPYVKGVTYMRPKRQNEALVWDSTPVEYKYALTNLCQDSRGGVKCMVVRDCLSFWEPINDEKYGELCFEKTGTKLDVYGIAGFGIEDGLLYPIYYLRTGGYIRGIDIAPLSSLIFARNGKGRKMSIAFQALLKRITSKSTGIAFNEIERALRTVNTEDSSNFLSYIPYFIDCDGKSQRLPALWYDKKYRLLYPLNMKNPVPILEEKSFSYGISASGGEYILLFALEPKDDIFCSLNNICMYKVREKYKGLSNHFFTENGVAVYEFEHIGKEITQNEVTLYLQDETNPYKFSKTSKTDGEPQGRSKTHKQNDFVNPICRLKMRAEPNLGAKVFGTLEAGTLLKIVQVGEQEQIDGVMASWAKVEAVNDEHFVEGGEVSTGWVFGGYVM